MKKLIDIDLKIEKEEELDVKEFLKRNNFITRNDCPDIKKLDHSQVIDIITEKFDVLITNNFSFEKILISKRKYLIMIILKFFSDLSEPKLTKSHLLFLLNELQNCKRGNIYVWEINPICRLTRLKNND